MPASVYLDYNATTPVAPEVAEAIRPYLYQLFGNPSSAHSHGRVARAAVDRARGEVADLLGARPQEVVFTGCATEASNLAILGAARAGVDERRHLVTSAVEHPAVMVPMRRLESEGWSLTVVPVDSTGHVAVADVERALRPDTLLVSIMHANNEVGTIQPIARIAALTRARGILLHTDAAQSVAKIPVNVHELGADLLSVAGHKFYATKGVGALWVRPGVRLAPPVVGADHEHGLRPGTENVPAIVGLGCAARLGLGRLGEATAHLTRLRDRLHQALGQAVPGLTLNGHPQARLPSTLNFSFPGVSGRDLLAAVDDSLSASLGSACHSEHEAVSGVLAAMGCNATRAMGAVRLSVGWPTTETEVDTAAHALASAWERLHARR